MDADETEQGIAELEDFIACYGMLKSFLNFDASGCGRHFRRSVDTWPAVGQSPSACRSPAPEAPRRASAAEAGTAGSRP